MVTTDVRDEVRRLCGEMLEAGPRKVLKVAETLVRTVRGSPEARDALPAWNEVPEAHQRAIVRAHEAAIRARDDVEALRAFVAELPAAYAASIVHSCGNARERQPWVPLMEDALLRDDPEMRLAALYFLGHWLSRDGGDAAPLAEGLVRAALDDRTGVVAKKKVSTEARRLLRPAALGSRDRAAFERAIEADAPPRSRAALVKELGDAPKPPKTVKEAIAALHGDVVRQRQGLAFLGSALVGDMVDIRDSFPRVAQLLASDDTDVRREAVMVAYYGCDLQGKTYEAQRLRPALEAVVGVADDASRAYVESALLQLTRSAKAAKP